MKILGSILIKHFKTILIICFLVVGYLVFRHQKTNTMSQNFSVISPSLKLLLFGSLATIVCLTIATILFFRIREYRSLKKKSDYSESDDDDIAKATTKTEKEAGYIKRGISVLREFPLLYPFYFISGWFMFTCLAWIFKEELPIWQWLRWEHQKLFWYTSVVIVIGVWFVVAKHRLLKLPGFLLWGTLAWAWLLAGWNSTTNAKWYKELQVEEVKTVTKAAKETATRWTLHWRLPDDMPDIPGVSRESPPEGYPVKVVKNDETGLDFYAYYQESDGNWIKTTYVCEEVQEDGMRKGWMFRPTPRDNPRRGKWYLYPDKDGKGFHGGDRDQFHSEDWILIHLVPN